MYHFQLKNNDGNSKIFTLLVLLLLLLRVIIINPLVNEALQIYPKTIITTQKRHKLKTQLPRKQTNKHI